MLTIQNNTIQNAEDDIALIDASSITITNNTFLLARRSSLSVIQKTPGSVTGLSLNGNTLYQRNIDYPYIEMRDEVPGSGIASLVSANGNSFITLYKPDTSYVRSVKFGGSSVEYTTKSSLSFFDTTSTTFQSFGYMPYTNTGSYVTANLLTNPSFESNITGWTASAMTGIAASLSQKI